MSLLKYKEDLKAITREQRSILELADRAGRGLTPGEEERYADLDEKYTATEDKLKELEGAVKRSELGRREGWYKPIPNSGKAIAADSWEGKSVRFIMPGEYKTETRAQRMSDLETRDLTRLLTVGYGGLTDSEKERYEQRRSLQMDQDVLGGFLVAPESFTSGVIFGLQDDSFMRDISTQLELKFAQTLSIPTEEEEIDDADFTAELRTGSEDDKLRFGKRTLTPHPCAKRLRVSNTLLQRAAGAQNYLAKRLTNKFAITEEKAFMSGNGAGQPLGIFVTSDLGVPASRDVSTGNSSTELKADNLIEVLMSLKPGYRKKACWVLHRDVLKAIRKLKDGQGNYLWQPGVTADRPDTILGKVYYESEYCPNTFTSGRYMLCVGDFSYFWIVTALNMQISVLKELYAETNEVGLIGLMEVDASCVLAEAFARSKLA